MQSKIRIDIQKRINEANIRVDERKKVLAEQAAKCAHYAAFPQERLQQRVGRNLTEIERLKRDKRYREKNRIAKIATHKNEIDSDLGELARRGIANGDPRLINFLLSGVVIPFRTR